MNELTRNVCVYIHLCSVLLWSALFWSALFCSVLLLVFAKLKILTSIFNIL